MESVHVPVLLHEIVAAFGRDSGFKNKHPIYLDCTLGGTGHAKAIARIYKGDLTIVGLDRDLHAIERAKKILEGSECMVILENADYRKLDAVLTNHKISGVDLILMDLGISSDELDTSGRGFTFRKDEQLLMTMGDPAGYPFTARTIVNDWDEAVIADVIFGYGEERFARRISRAIVSYRAKTPIETTQELAEIIASAVPPFYRRGKIHPATKTFQALRIAVNDELNALKEGIVKAYAALNPGGRMAIISFHSLEDRIVKDFYKEKARHGDHLITNKPITATDQEIAENPRARSAKLRIIEKAKLS